jgi:hypothetical protein
MNLIELRPGLFINLDHVAIVRVLPQEEGDDYAILQLSNGDKQMLTSGEFSRITGTEPHPTARAALVGSSAAGWMETSANEDVEGDTAGERSP